MHLDTQFGLGIIKKKIFPKKQKHVPPPHIQWDKKETNIRNCTFYRHNHVKKIITLTDLGTLYFYCTFSMRCTLTKKKKM